MNIIKFKMMKKEYLALLSNSTSNLNLNRRKFIRETAMAMATAAFSLGPVLSAHSENNNNKPNIIYILTDQWRASATGYAGDPNVRTPNLDRLEKESLNFRNAVSVCPVCTPYRASLMTGRYPTSTGMFLNDAHLPDSELCIAEVFSGAGYKTAYIGKWHLDGHGRSAYIPPERRQGFEYWKAAECSHDYNRSHYYTGNSNEKLFWEGYDVFAQTKDAQHYIMENANQPDPFLLFISYGAPHFPHERAPEEYKALYPPEKIKLPPNISGSFVIEAKKEAQGYYAHCEAIDKSIGDLLTTVDNAGIRENTILVFTSDHGEMLGSHGVRPKQKQVPWNESAGVPFLLRFPAAHGNKGRMVDMPITTPDIFPTLLGLSGIGIPGTVEGDDHSAVITEGREKENHAALYMLVAPFLKSEHAKEYRAIRTDRYTYVQSLEGPWLLYDNTEDPFQLNNLVSKPEYSSLVSEMKKMVHNLLGKVNDDFRPGKYYIDEWGFKPASHGSVPYHGDDIVPQTPTRKFKK
jgi:arylsulfatase A-like enzyme